MAVRSTTSAPAHTEASSPDRSAATGPHRESLNSAANAAGRRLAGGGATTVASVAAMPEASRVAHLRTLSARERAQLAASLPHTLSTEERSVASALFDATPDTEVQTVRRTLIALTGSFRGVDDDPKARDPHPTSALTPEQKHRAEQLTSLFENSTTELQYSYIEDIHDGRGFTAGRAGFCTGTGDFYEVVVDYTHRVPHNPLAQYLPELRQLAAHESGRTDRLPNIVHAWHEAARDPAFRAVQDGVVDKLYYSVAMAFADEHGCRLPLSLAALYDAVIQHGAGNDPDGLPALIARTSGVVGGDPRHGADERRWLKVFLRVRRQDLAYAEDADTREAWSESTGRADVFLSLANEGNYDLAGPIRLHAGGYTDKIN